MWRVYLKRLHCDALHKKEYHQRQLVDAFRSGLKEGCFIAAPKYHQRQLVDAFRSGPQEGRFIISSEAAIVGS
jgi:hypothetical protein